MTYEISDTQVAAFRAYGSAVIEAYLESKEWQRNRGDGPRNIWYRQEVAYDLCWYCDNPDGPVDEDPYCPVHDDATWTLVWPCGNEAHARDALLMLCRVEGRGPEEILHALGLRDWDEVRARSERPLWQQIRHPDLGVDFFITLDKVQALAAGHDETEFAEGAYPSDGRRYEVEMVSENEVLFTFRHDEPLTRDSPPCASRQAAQDLVSVVRSEEHPSDRRTHMATRYATGEWTTVDVMMPEDLPPSTALEKHVSSLFHQYGLTTWTFDQALPSTAPQRST